MKKLLLITLLSFSINSFAQNLPTKEELFEGCTVIIVETTDRTSEAFKKVQKAFKDEGFTIITTDKDIFTIVANQTLEGVGDIKVNASINQAGSNQIIFSGTLGNGVKAASASGESKIANTGSSESASKKAFDKMHEVALSYKGAKVSYGVN